MQYFPPALEKLVEQFARLPGIGRKTAQRLAFFVLSLPEEDAAAFADAIVGAKAAIHCCPVCQNFSEGDGLCPVCQDPKRDTSVICVVADPKDVVAMERSREYPGLYHVLHGVISPMNHVGPDDIRVKELVDRVAKGDVREVIMATNPDTEGEATAMYLSRLLKPAWPTASRWAAIWSTPTTPPSCAPWRAGGRCRMRRVLVIGCPGAGKSTLTRALAETLGLPAVYLDRLWWKSGWINRTRAEFEARLDAALAGDAWVMDGNYLRTLPRRLERCDAVLFLDYPRRLCLFRALRRILRWRGRTRPDMAEGCPERLDPAFIRWIWDFHRTQRPRVLELLDGWKGEAHIFRSPAQCAAFLAQQKNQNTPGTE